MNEEDAEQLGYLEGKLNRLNREHVELLQECARVCRQAIDTEEEIMELLEKDNE